MAKINLNDPIQWLDFKSKISALHPTFFELLVSRHSKITRIEEKVCASLIAGCTSKEIAEMLEKDPHSVDNIRSGLRKKFGLKNLNDDIQKYLKDLK